MPLPTINPSILNSANPWCTTKEHLLDLWNCQYVGAVTTRTSLLGGFPDNPSIHQHTFFNVTKHHNSPPEAKDGCTDRTYNASLNTHGYSPYNLSQYLIWIREITNNAPSYWPSNGSPQCKPFIISVTGSPTEILSSYNQISDLQAIIPHTTKLLMEINLSCPNIPSKPPPAYSGPELLSYLHSLSQHPSYASAKRVPVGIKTPPYTYGGQFLTLISTLSTFTKEQNLDVCPVDFITATNTLGSCLVYDAELDPILSSANGEGIGGLAGAALHPLALGNVRTIRKILDECPELKDIDIIGVGGVDSGDAARRMLRAGAKIVAVGTAFGMEGVNVFERLHKGDGRPMSLTR